ncbi:TIGR02391 family protein [Singulisphaera sp. Ch08]|uniref:TIGR02391 family protein n=1 Tax=Singulisphaera sp. Ch08 TaxID=3120278 RepID=A0AAU7C9W6_9BACT
MAIPKFDATHLEQLSRILVEAASHAELTRLMTQCDITEQGGTPRWERMLLALSARQQKDGCGNNVGAFMQAVMAPVRFIGRQKEFDELRHPLNEALAFNGLHLGEDGKLVPVTKATTLTEAQERAGRLRAELQRRQVHPDVLRFCKPELLEENYFHAILEATKSVADKLRSKTGLVSDGTPLADAIFAVNSPRLALNRLLTESERSEQTGFSNLLKGVFGVFRNQTAHEPKITKTYTEQDALDLLTLVSYMHGRINSAFPVPQFPSK